MKPNQIKNLVTTALFAAAIAILILFIRLPIPGQTQGYVNLGDSVIYLAAYILPAPYAMAAGALGGAIADLSVGAVVYAVPTAVIKALMALEAAFFFKLAKKTLGSFLALVIGAFVLVGGYFIFELVVWGWAYAVSGLVWNLFQGVAGSIFYIPMSKVADLLRDRFKEN